MRHHAAVAATLLAAACSPSAAPHTTAPSPHTSTAPALTSALADIYANRYSAAARTLVTMIATTAQRGDAAATYALLLNYAGRQDAAATEATLATAAAPRSGYAAAILCRVRDWSGDIEGAVAAGRRAVQLAPGDPLPHLLLAEALADSGRLTDSQAQIDAARPLIAARPTAFLRAELLREQGNLAGDRGDDAGRLGSFRAAQAQQPGWLYRTSELVDALSAADQMDEARQTLAAAVAGAPADAVVLATLGSEAISVDDSALATGVWRRAAALAPSDGEILVGAGAVEVAAAHDDNAAIDDFQAALRADPGNVRAAAYLLGLARFVRHDPASGQAQVDEAVAAAGGRPGQRAGAPVKPEDALAADQQRALQAVNQARASAALPPVTLDSRLSTSALSHSYYWLFNNLSPTVAGLGIHQETPGLAGYSGGFPWTRATAFGYPNQHIGEDIDHRGDPVKAVDEWVNSVFHRFAILRPDLKVVGYGEAAAGPILMEDLEFGFTTVPSRTPVLYPGDGQRGVPAIFVDNELPDPVPQGQPRTTGSPVTVTFDADAIVRVSSFTLQDAGGASLECYAGTPSGSTENSAWLLPHAALAPNATYTAHIVATVDGQAFDRSWTFSTGS